MTQEGHSLCQSHKLATHEVWPSNQEVEVRKRQIMHLKAFICPMR